MNMSFDLSIATEYHSKSQKARVLTENWVSKNLFCPKCGYAKMEHFKNNSPVADFYCPNCHEQYELKSKGGKLGKKINGSAYEAMMKRIASFDNPNFLFMSYSKEDFSVNNLVLVPKFFFVPDIIEKRRPLKNTARRAGWIGCNILLEQIPAQGIIPIVTNGRAVCKKHVISQTQKAQKLQIQDIASRSWLFDILHCVNSIEAGEFELAEMYKFEAFLVKIHPENHHIQPKIRQQLQVLRDKGVIKFIGRGKYRKL